MKYNTNPLVFLTITKYIYIYTEDQKMNIYIYIHRKSKNERKSTWWCFLLPLPLSLSSSDFYGLFGWGGRREAEGRRLKLAKNKLFTILYFSYLSRIIIAWNVLRITLGVWHKQVSAHTWWNSSFNEPVSMVKIAPMVTLTVRLSFSPVLLL